MPLHIPLNGLLALGIAVPLLQGGIDVLLRDLVGRGRDRCGQRGIQFLQKLLMQPVMERGHIKVQADKLEIIRCRDNTTDSVRTLQISVLAV